MASYSLVVFIEGRTNKANSCSYMSGFATAEIAQAALESIKASLPGVDVHGTVLGASQGEYWATQAAAGAIDLTDVETLLQDIRSNTSNINSTGLTNTELRTAPVPISGSVTAAVSNFPATQPVSGTVTVTGPLTDTQLRAVAVPVSGAFYPATQPISGTVSVSNLPVTQPISGTVTASVSNFPATQPISGTVTATGPLTDTQLRAVAVPVSGTFFQATQPVSGTVTATGPLTDTQLRATAVPVSGPLTDTQLRASPLVTTDRTDITFYAHFDRIVPATNKYMAVVFNTSAVKKIVFKRIEVMFRGASSVTGVVLDQYLTKIDFTVAGTVITPFAEDPSDPLAAGITCSHNDTGIVENHIIKRFTATSEEPKIGAGMAEDAGTFGSIVLYEAAPGTRGLTSRQNKGIAIRNLTNSTVGTVSYFFLFTVQDA